MTKDKAFVISTGYITLLMGLITVVLHNVWTYDWPVIITILGWSTLIKGIMKVGFPEVIHKQSKKFKKNQIAEAATLVMFGIILVWLSFI